MKGKIFIALMFFLPLMIGLFCFFHSQTILGDLGDARFNMYILEHGYRWLSGLAPSYWSASFFFPAKNVVAFSDNLLGSMPIYALSRWLGNNRESSYQQWLILCFILNYASSYWVLRQWAISLIGALAGAYLFTFGLPVMAQIGHPQLIPRFMVPIGFYFWIRFFITRRPLYFSISLGALLWQIYIGIYTGFFLGLSFLFCLFALLPSPKNFFLLRSHFSFRKKTAQDLYLFLKITALRFAGRDFRYYWVAIALFLLGLLPLAIPYSEAARTVGTHSWNDISLQLPRIASYFRGPESILYGKEMNFGNTLPLPGEQQLFLGWIPIASLISFALIGRYRIEKQNPFPSRILIGSVFISIIMTLDIHGLSLYWFISRLPGAGAIRGVSRIILVMLFPISAILGYCITRFEEIDRFLSEDKRNPYSKWRLIGVVAVVPLLIIDQMSIVPSFGKDSSRGRIESLKNELQNTIKNDHFQKNYNNNVFWINQGSGNFVETQIDAMLAGQDLGWKTINGYSGNLPLDYGVQMFFLKSGKCREFARWIHSHKNAFNGKNVVIVGKPCKGWKESSITSEEK